MRRYVQTILLGAALMAPIGLRAYDDHPNGTTIPSAVIITSGVNGKIVLTSGSWRKTIAIGTSGAAPTKKSRRSTGAGDISMAMKTGTRADAV